MVDYILKYGTDNLIIIYQCIYFGLSDIIENVIWNSMKLMRDIGSGPQIDEWLE